VKPAPFAYHAPRTLAEAIEVLGALGHDGKILAGGQSLIPMLSMRLAAPAHLIDINAVAGLNEIAVTPEAVRVGATVRHRALERSPQAYAVLPLLRQALVNVAHPAIRNRGTTVGSIAHADAAGEMPAVAALTGAVMEVAGPGGPREISAADFFTGPLETTLAPEEILTAVRFSRFPEGTLTGFLESARRSGDYAMAGVGVAVTVKQGSIVAARASFVSVTDIPDVLDLTPVLADVSAQDLPTRWDDLRGAVREHVSPESDIHASADYRRMLAGELTCRVVTQVMTR
jgi:carbon-monoxide dehydrogenase medium subunit